MYSSCRKLNRESCRERSDFTFVKLLGENQSTILVRQSYAHFINEAFEDINAGLYTAKLSRKFLNQEVTLEK